MMRSMWSAVAGLKTHQLEMDVIGNNIANVNTTAYKSQATGFQDVLSFDQLQLAPAAAEQSAKAFGFASDVTVTAELEGNTIKSLTVKQVADLLGHTTTEITELYYVKKDNTKLEGLTDAFNL